ncbi:glycosyltransferase involved in cell wall biosynthesis [Oxalobacteraceae bacterium GrIS 1.11]
MELLEYTAEYGSYPPPQSWRRPFWLGAAACSRFAQIRRAHCADLSILQREFISTLPSLEGLTKGPRVLDVDDAIWLYRRGAAANHLGRVSDHIVCGNQFLAEHFSRFGKPLSIVPTAVDIAKFQPLARRGLGRRIIGWSGTFGGYEYFAAIEEKLARLLAGYPDWMLRIVSDRAPKFEHIAPSQLEYLPWSPENEVRCIAEMDIGLMPLDDTPWSRGKCSYKMLLYMACGIPVVVADMGMNREILNMGEVGIGALSPDDWIAALESLMRDEGRCQRLGANGRELVERQFSIATVADQWQRVLASLLPSKQGR